MRACDGSTASRSITCPFRIWSSASCPISSSERGEEEPGDDRSQRESSGSYEQTATGSWGAAPDTVRATLLPRRGGSLGRVRVMRSTYWRLKIPRVERSRMFPRTWPDRFPRGCGRRGAGSDGEDLPRTYKRVPHADRLLKPPEERLRKERRWLVTNCRTCRTVTMRWSRT